MTRFVVVLLAELVVLFDIAGIMIKLMRVAAG